MLLKSKVQELWLFALELIMNLEAVAVMARSPLNDFVRTSSYQIGSESRSHPASLYIKWNIWLIIMKMHLPRKPLV